MNDDIKKPYLCTILLDTTLGNENWLEESLRRLDAKALEEVANLAEDDHRRAADFLAALAIMRSEAVGVYPTYADTSIVEGMGVLAEHVRFLGHIATEARMSLRDSNRKL